MGREVAPCRLAQLALGVLLLLLCLSAGQADEKEEDPNTHLGRDHPNLAEIKQFLGPSLACENCLMSMDKFRFEVARKIKSSMSQTKKEKVFDERLPIPCSGKRGWPKMMAVRDENGRDKYVDVIGEAESDKASKENPMAGLAGGNKKKTGNYKQFGVDVKNNAMDACRYFIQGNRKRLLEAIMNNEGGRASNVNFHRMICTRKKVCKDEDIPAGKGDGDEDDVREDL
mmetsp:Transcript_63720/g.111181  ORF Transcript_63720/g.111181 Transcript_63720/m.111181 type:complete len:228 (+) Transcript_63720:55-738(+)